jgi:hydroxymethylpyrimidine pyrophosphatase-like HAD family hydrolase
MGGMRFTALACDYDGTLATHGRIATSTLDALERARAAGLRLLLVTGRTFFELTHVCDRLDVFDVVVAENGGVLYFPREGRICDLAVGPPPRLLAELDRRAVPYQAGRVVIGTTRDYEDEVCAALSASGVNMTVVANRESLMLLPPGVHKGTSVRHVIRMLGLSAHDVLALGDAENDADLFDACGFAGCPGNAIEELKARADWVFAGENGTAIAGAVARILDGRLLPPARGRRSIRLGWAGTGGEPVVLPSRDTSVLIQGDPWSGKSWLAGVLVERLGAERYATCVIDPEGEHHVLAALPGVTWFAVQREEEWGQVLAALRHDPSATVIADLSGTGHVDKVHLIGAGLARIRAMRAERGLPHWVVLDEAHYSLPAGGVRPEMFRADEKGFCFVTHRASRLAPAVLESIDVFIVARTTWPEELAFLRARLGATERGAAPALAAREFLFDPRGGETVLFVAPPRLTRQVPRRGRNAHRLVTARHTFHFRLRDQSPVATAATLAEFAGAVGFVDETVLAHHAAQGDFSRWIGDVFDDRDLVAHLRKVEQRWTRGEIVDLRPALVERLDLEGAGG